MVIRFGFRMSTSLLSLCYQHHCRRQRHQHYSHYANILRSFQLSQMVIRFGFKMSTSLSPLCYHHHLRRPRHYHDHYLPAVVYDACGHFDPSNRVKWKFPQASTMSTSPSSLSCRRHRRRRRRHRRHAIVFSQWYTKMDRIVFCRCCCCFS